MKLRGSIAAVVLICVSVVSAMAQSRLEASRDEAYVPKLGDIMNAAQTRHIKLWYAAKAANWDLARFELGQLKANLVEAALLYSGIPVTNVTTLAPPLQSVADAIDAKDGQRFAKAYGDLTGGCNACHQSMERAFIVIRTPTEQPFGDQVFPPAGKK
jgi:cytochrome c556